jgi:lipopolysaccharide transport system ATP-binding protein
MPTVSNLCQRVALLRSGQLLEIGPTAGVIDRYLTEAADVPTGSLADRKDRHGQGAAISTLIELLDQQGYPMQSPMSGVNLTIRQHYRCDPGRTFQNCVMSIAIIRDERPYIVLSTDLVDTRQIDIEGEGYIDFIVPELPLSAGNYAIAAYIGSNGEMQDYISRAAEMPVIDGDFFGTGKAMLPGWHGQIALVKHSWRLDSDMPAAESLVGVQQEA